MTDNHFAFFHDVTPSGQPKDARMYDLHNYGGVLIQVALISIIIIDFAA